MKIKLLIFLLFGCLSVKVNATSLNESMAKEKDDFVERIEVFNKMPLYRLKHNIEKAKVDFLETFNRYNDIRDFNIICRREPIAGSNFRTRVCEQYFFKEKRGELNRGLSNGSLFRLGINSPSGALRAATEEKRQLALEHFAKLINENPELQEKYFMLKNANVIYQKRIQEKRKSGS